MDNRARHLGDVCIAANQNLAARIDVHSVEADHILVAGILRAGTAPSSTSERVTETRSGFTVDGKEFHNDIRVYDKIVPADWPGEIRAPQ